jgi:hypothetical protein
MIHVTGTVQQDVHILQGIAHLVAHFAFHVILLCKHTTGKQATNRYI